MLFALMLAQASDVGSQVFTGIATGGGVLTVATFVFKYMIELQKSTFQALISANNAHIVSLTEQLRVVNESHTKHLEKENMIVNVLNGIQINMAGLTQTVQALGQTVQAISRLTQKETPEVIPG